MKTWLCKPKKTPRQLGNTCDAQACPRMRPPEDLVQVYASSVKTDFRRHLAYFDLHGAKQR